MSADFSKVSASEDTPGHVVLSGSATTSESTSVAVTVTVGAAGETDVFSFQEDRERVVDVPTVIQSVSDDQGGVWVVADDGQSAQLSS